MQLTRGYFDKRLNNAVVRITAQVDHLTTIMAANNEGTPVLAAIATPPSDYMSGNVIGAPNNGMPVTIPPTSVITIGPFAMHAGEELTFNSAQRNLTVFVTVQTDDPNPQVAMWE